VQSTSYLCEPTGPTTIDGSVVVRNSVDVAQLAGVTTITGNLTIDAAGLTSLDLSSLQSVAGTITVGSYSGTTLTFPALLSAGSLTLGAYTGNLTTLTTFEAPALLSVGTLRIDNIPVATIALPALTSADHLSIEGDRMTSFSFPQLASVDSISFFKVGFTTFDFASVFPHVTALDSLSVSASPALTSFTLGGADITQSLSVHYNQLLTTLDAGELTSVGSLFIQENYVLTSLDLAALTTINGSVFIRVDDALTTVALPALTTATTADGAQFQIADNLKLQTISAPNWTTFGGAGAARYFGVYSNPKLPTCAAQALATQVGATNVNIAGNYTAGTCP
jgi:hypothetical protein